MEFVVSRVKSSDLLSKSNLPASDFVINPYVGCLHSCKYCYACFMKRFTGHNEAWGQFLDIKVCDKPIDKNKIAGKSVFMSSVTDCYNPIERKEELTRRILNEIKDVDCELTITTKSSLVTRDIDILKQCKNVTIAISINTLDERFRADMDKASSIYSRIETLKTLHENGIRTVLFMSPIFPEITDFKAIVTATQNFVNEYWFENLNLRGDYKYTIFDYIRNKYPQLYKLYYEIYTLKQNNYWSKLKDEIKIFCDENKVNYQIFFHHEKIRKNN